MSKSLSEEIHFALCCISECCVDESKRNITSRKAVEQIREYLSVITDDRYSKNFNISLKREILQKDQRIAELEKENKRLNTKLEIWNRFDKEDYIHRGEKATERDYYYYTNGVSAVLENEVERLNHDLAVRNKALELAVKDKIKYENVLLEEFAGMGAKPALRKKEQYYLDQAEKELKGEK